MRILICHNSYQQSGGEDMVVSAEYELLKKQDVEVELYQVSNDGISNPLQKIKTGLSVSYSDASKESLLKFLKKYRPDLVHFHNIFPLLTPSVYDACNEQGIAVVQTLHNFRNICPGALLMRNGEICERCITASPYQAVRFACYRDSYIQTLAVANMVQQHRKKQTWENKIDRFIALTDFSRNKFIAAGFPSEKICTKPNFISELDDFDIPTNKEYALFVGRLSIEKGVDTLCDAFSNLNIPLKIAGDGPLRETLEKKTAAHIKFLGPQNKKNIYSLMRNARVLIMPSICYEGFPMVLAEAFAHGLPVICSRLGSMAEIVKDQHHGIHFSPKSSADLAEKVEWLFSNIDQAKIMGNNAHNTYLEKYTPDRNIHMLLNIYQEALHAKQAS